MPTSSKGPMAKPMNATVNRTRILRRIFCVFLRWPALTGRQRTLLTYDRIGLAQDPVWDVEPHGGGGFQVDPQEIFGRLHQEIARLFPFENLVYQPGCLLPLVGLFRAIGEEHIFDRD